jgi:dethiobiotin synthetase
MKKSTFITSTGTNIGKTFLTKILIKRAIELNYNVNALKPIISGFNIDDFNKSDTGIIMNALGFDIKNINNISPWRFKEPLSPDIAAKKAGKYIEFEDLIKFCNKNINSKNDDLLIIEGVGGTMVPINDEYTILDLMKRLSISVILTVGSYLGSISHTLNAYEILKKFNIKISFIIIMQSDKNDIGVQATKNSLKNHIKSIPIIYFKRNNIDNIKVDNILKSL